MGEEKQHIVRKKSFHFAVRIVRLVQYLRKEKNEYVLSKQLLRSGTSIGANLEEANASLTTKEFSSKVSISYKECKETSYWLRLFHATGYLTDAEFASIFSDVDELGAILFSILKSTDRIKD